MKSVRRRRNLVLSLIASQAIDTQEELVEALGRQGVVASQASVSRDIAALGLIKGGGRYALPGVARPGRNPLEERLREFLLSVAPAGDHLLVLKTPPGEASGVALALDRLDAAGVVGTVAGDDTILVAVTDANAKRDVARRLHAIMRARPDTTGGA